MGSEQSTAGGKKEEEASVAGQVLQSPTTAALREGALSPRQGSVCSDTDVPYVSYTVNKPIGESPKKVAKPRSGRFSSPRLSRSLNRSRLAQSAHNTLVTVNKERTDNKADMDLVRLSQIPTFLPIMQGSQADQADILARLDSGPLSRMLQRYEDHLRTCATLVAAEQGNINRKIREVDTAMGTVATGLQDRQKKYEKHCEKLAGVREVSRTLAKCHMLLNENIDMMDALNNSLPVDMRLEPFVWTTG
eukprot:GFUD01044638.1.p1 GENE.GFUD01044638.1~~GFUD01044638.1.p1  ORF type:complete len:248 (-),score=77.67 GFUD01044638.1:209-952(-)